MSLSGKTIKNSYVDLLQLDNSNSGVPTSLTAIKDGAGSSTALQISDDNVRILPQNDDTNNALQVRAKGTGNVVLSVDTTNETVTASGNTVNTQYAYFSIGNAESAFFSSNTHTAITFSSANFGTSATPPTFGTGTDPATTFTTANSNNERASDLVPTMWYIADNMVIDAVYSIEGADTATGDTTRMHLMSYDFTSGATACLTNGTLLAHNSDVTNAGSEQPYLSTWTIDSSSVASGKVILALFRSDSINSDYSVNIKIKYHLT
tara:strand:+ start:2482 stop:3273 length:792 start_codon:yes stop_codon:yes gene_type:complete